MTPIALNLARNAMPVRERRAVWPVGAIQKWRLPRKVEMTLRAAARK